MDITKSGYTIIDNFLPVDIATRLYEIYSAEENWERQDQYRKDHYKHVFKFTRPELPKETEAYRAKFWRSEALKNNAEINKIYETAFVNRIEDAIKTSVVSHKLSCMKCERGDYYRTHIDGWQGDYNSIFYINKDWTWDWGGLLHVVEDKEDGYFETILPKFNRLVILHNDKFKCPHFVTPVNEYAEYSRYTLASWINLKEQK
tara:strand:- start:1618 stop:2226 length:609 start_codon:yes stop_codon:yes gene_type:complete